MTFNDYQELTSRTASEHKYEVVNYALGIFGESGELIDEFKKHIFHGHKIRKDYVKKEAGDSIWYASQLARMFDVDFSNYFDVFNERIKTYKIDDELIMISILNLSRSIGWVSSYIDKRVFGEERTTKKAIQKELGIVLTNIFYLIHAAGLTVEEVAEANIEKLEVRYPKGFNTEDSVQRVDTENEKGDDKNQ